MGDAGTPGSCVGGPGAAVTFPSARVAVAVTGWAQPMVAPIPAPGWTVRCFAWSDLVSRPRWVQAEIAAAVQDDRRSGAFPAGSERVAESSAAINAREGSTGSRSPSAVSELQG